MTIDCIKLYDKLPCDLKRIIHGMCHHEIYYLKKCSNMCWDDLYEQIYITIDYDELNAEMLLKMLKQNPYISKLQSECGEKKGELNIFDMHKWFYYDYIKHYVVINGVRRYGGTEWYWDDSCTNYQELADVIVDYLQQFDNFYHHNQSNGETINLEGINEIYQFIFQECKKRMLGQNETTNEDKNANQ